MHSCHEKRYGSKVVSKILLFDIGSTYTKAIAIDTVKAEFLGSARAFTTVATDINDGLTSAKQMLKNVTNIEEFDETYACSSAAGGLKMIAIGLVGELTAEAAKMAALSAGAKLLKTFCFELSESEIKEIKRLSPDIILLCGGTNGGNKEVLIANAKHLADAKMSCLIIVAGNKTAESEICRIFEKSKTDFVLTENVMPKLNELNIVPAKETIRKIFLDRIVRAKGMTKVESVVNGILMPTPSAVMNSVNLLSKGTKKVSGIGEVVLIDIGGATTDVFSVCSGMPDSGNVVFKGLPEPFSKRTVEGDLGVRYTASSVIDECGLEAFCEYSKLNEESVKAILTKIDLDKSYLSKDKDDIAFESALVAISMEIALCRHSGTIGEIYTPMGLAYVQTGKNLCEVKYVIATGGSFLCAKNKKEIFDLVLKNKKGILKPIKPKLAYDKNYLFAGIGLIADKYPEVAIKILMSNLEDII